MGRSFTRSCGIFCGVMFKNAKLLLANRQLIGCTYTQLSTAAGRNVNCPQRDFFTFSDLTNKNREYAKKELIGYSMQEMYDVVADVSNYYKFVPYVKKSLVHSKRNDGFKADLIVGFPPLNESYTSNVSLQNPVLVKSVCTDGRLFNYLRNNWRFSPGLKDIPQSCVVDFKVAFEFKSLIHSNIANIFFDLICDQMDHAFVAEAERRYGPPSIKSLILWRRS
ncbi:coenzyme Q-binding protein COQ10, mitochondrial-like [Anastrepha ludens]|uniref:coenzyme Q-binding protein COQ10, mitochondrial-like n=2 Tax=Anastrepha ludens TaxID=28586 RepID=UPI0023B1F2D0|nr:coenzyme Q-binding protein COQ10, mitochondrial-like [Anastrepha ludens]XP_053965934.1 coenzyme Q-binding protein COQ10, mitochondrial-like [Anastrepha ludens]XP_053966070.1 coenzyme Q-binding protein COQ10, mitochondrial-like [Anastrepha ludens]XP_053966166.1 coenzyme Q-binding protein COQ10, mitochondrial-like [Anastrepha ludens]